jgi:ABC-2 type transport system permease protein
MSNLRSPATIARIVTASALAVGRTKVQTSGLIPYALVWLMFPVFALMIVGLIYRENQDLRDYAIIGGAGVALLFGMLFSAGEILDEERQRGTLGNLFLAPCTRLAWLGGMQLFAIVEALVIAGVTLTTGALLFGLTLDVDLATVVVVLGLFVVCMWGISMIVGAIGVAIRGANQLSNLLFAPLTLTAGTMYPIALMPDWVRIPARMLPFGYGMQALVDATTKGASLADVASDLLPLAGFAVALPVLGVMAFRQLERLTRRRGSLELT